MDLGEIGRGNYGTVNKMKHKESETEMAVKVNCFSKSFLQQCLNFFHIPDTRFFHASAVTEFCIWLEIGLFWNCTFFYVLVCDLLYGCTEYDKENNSNNN